MPSVPIDIIQALQANPKNIRNICIVAHVDHGKTTFADSLISSNGIISNKLAGKIKYMDNRPDEQERQITMKSSSISLLYQKKSKTGEPSKSMEDAYLMNLIDSPGHVDFSCEVSTAVRISDGCLVLVDVIEGVCIQTIAVLRQAWAEKVKPILVINKIDRLIYDLVMTPQEAYDHIKKVVEQVNVVTGTLFAEEMMKEYDKRDDSKTLSDADIDWEGFEEKESVYFSPDRGNVVFASAIDLWAFRIEHFSEMYAQKLGVKAEVLLKTLWGEFYLNPKTKKIHTKNITGRMLPMFAQFVLTPIWEVYNSVHDKTKMEKIINALKLKIPPRDLTGEDPKTIAQAIMSKWLPCADAVLEAVAEQLPSPLESQLVRIPKLWQTTVGAPSEITEKQKALQDAMNRCDPNGETIVYVSKVVQHSADSIVRKQSMPKPRMPRPRGEAAPASEAPAPAPEPVAPVKVDDKKDKFVGFARIFSGTIRRGQQIHVLGPKYNPLEPGKHHTVMTVEELYVLMGKELELIEQIPAGNVFGIGEIEKFIIKSATLSTSEICPTFNTMTFASSPIVRVAVEPENISDLSRLNEGLKILNQADPSVEVLIQETGEHVICASGELHLERCLRDLRENFAKIPLRVSPHIVAFRETITPDPSSKFKENKEGVHTANRLGTIRVRAVPLPENIRRFLESNTLLIRKIFVEESVDIKENEDVKTFRDKMYEEFEMAGKEWAQELKYLWAFGPKRQGANILLNHIQIYKDNFHSLINKLDADSIKIPAETGKKLKLKEVKETFYDDSETDSALEASILGESESLELLKDVSNSIVTGFQLATASGPLCEEPMTGVCFIVEDITLRVGDLDNRGPFSGQIMSATKEACRQSFLSHSCRLVQAMYLCYIQVPPEVMGKVFGVLGRRRAKILKEEQKEGTNIFLIEALLPVVESFGLSVELLTETSGSASTQLMFHGFEVLDQDPYFIPVTEEELEEMGENLGGIAPNIALQYMNAVRNRKGLHVEEQLVKFANKQRTLARKK